MTSRYGNRAARLHGVNISAECADLINQLMTVNPRNRPTAVQALNHPWFNVSSPSRASSADGPLTDEDMAEVAANIKAFRGFSTLKRLAVVAIAVS